MSGDSTQETTGFFSRMFSEDPTASSQRIVGLLSFVVAVVLAVLSIKAYYDFLWFCAAMFGVKEVRKAVSAFKPATKQPTEPKTPSTPAPITTTKKPDEPKPT